MAQDSPIPQDEERRLLTISSECHSRERVIGPRLRVITKYASDELNSRTETVLMMKIGGAASGGIHGAHMGAGVHIRYAAADRKRQTIPWVEYRNGGVTRTYVSADAKPDGLSRFETRHFLGRNIHTGRSHHVHVHVFCIARCGGDKKEQTTGDRMGKFVAEGYVEKRVWWGCPGRLRRGPIR